MSRPGLGHFISSTVLLVLPVLVKIKDCDDLNFSFLSEADEVTDPDFWDISEISTSSSTSTVPFSQNSMSWCVTSLFLKYLPSFWVSG